MGCQWEGAKKLNDESLGNRSALDWLIDQYHVAEHPDFPEHQEDDVRHNRALHPTCGSVDTQSVRTRAIAIA